MPRTSLKAKSLFFEDDPAAVVEVASSDQVAALSKIDEITLRHESQYLGRFIHQERLSRSHVSFQANKNRPFYRWFKYKEAFSAELVEFMLTSCGVTSGTVFDPFAGIGTTLFAAGELGLKSEGIELLPIGCQVIKTKQITDWEITREDVDTMSNWITTRPWRLATANGVFNELRITKDAYPPDTSAAIMRYLAALQKEVPKLRSVLIFALLCVLERISFTRKDGQYLRWDFRSGRHAGKKMFDKGRILSFDEAIQGKLGEIVGDLIQELSPSELFPTNRTLANITLHEGSCLRILPQIPPNSFDAIMTSPPYCNRYDYTRTYALELALLGVSEASLVNLRQEMLSCTVENRAKDLLSMNDGWTKAISVADDHELLQVIIRYLDELRREKRLNNNGIPRMVRGYFYEMACVISECARVLKCGAPLIMINDNVRYAGASVAVDVILSDFASQLGFEIEKIMVLPNGKGNSSQQMGAHGRETLRKCVYVWRKH